MNLLERQVDKINRQVYFMYTPQYDPLATPPGKNNRWIYDRAPEGYKFILDSVDISSRISGTVTKAVWGMFDGHEFTNWLLFPGVESKEYLCRAEVNIYAPNAVFDLHNWECKEYTIAGRSLAETEDVKLCIIVWYYLRKMSWLEKLQYAVLQPRGQRYRKSGATTVERSERDG